MTKTYFTLSLLSIIATTSSPQQLAYLACTPKFTQRARGRAGVLYSRAPAQSSGKFERILRAHNLSAAAPREIIRAPCTGVQVYIGIALSSSSKSPGLGRIYIFPAGKLSQKREREKATCATSFANAGACNVRTQNAGNIKRAGEEEPGRKCRLHK